MRAAVFDLDGTLADTSADLISAANAALSELGHAPLLDAVKDRATAFLGGRAMLRLGLERSGAWDDATVTAGYPRLLEAYGRDIDRRTRLFPGALDVVRSLTASGWAVGICTNKPEALADTLLRRLGVRDAFAALVGADTLPVRKPDPAAFHETLRRLSATTGVMIGDTDTDRQTARNAGVPCVLVTFGAEADPRRLDPHAVIDSFAQLPSALARL